MTFSDWAVPAFSVMLAAVGVASATAAGIKAYSLYKRVDLSLPERTHTEDVLSGFTLSQSRVAELLEDIQVMKTRKGAGVEVLPEPTRRAVVKLLADLDQERIELLRKVQRLQAEIEGDERRYTLIRAYASQGLLQTRISFIASVAAAALGFCVILIGASMAVAGASPASSVVPVVSGAVIDAVSLLFFAQDRSHQRTMFEFFERLREDRKLDEALLLARTTDDPRLRSRIQAAMVLHFASIPNAIEILDGASTAARTSTEKPDRAYHSTAGQS